MGRSFGAAPFSWIAPQDRVISEQERVAGKLMSEEGFDDRRRAGEQRIAERNAEELGQTLEGPGSEARLERLQSKFKSSSSGSREPGASTLLLIGLAVFLTVLLFGLGKPFVEKMAAQVGGQPPPAAVQTR